MKKHLPTHTSDTNDLYGVSIKTGFPNPAIDSPLDTPDFNKLLIRHPVATYCMRISGQGWERLGIFDGDTVVIDRALHPTPLDLVVWWQDDFFAMGRQARVPANAEPWGTVSAVIHQYR
jgi:DNA polymerase V